MPKRAGASLLLLAILLQGCTSAARDVVWIRANTSNEQRDADLRGCESYATTLAVGKSQSPALSGTPVEADDALVEDCMTRAGYLPAPQP
jgi:hypothetical protein